MGIVSPQRAFSGGAIPVCIVLESTLINSKQ
jgi:hypothetical protein